MIVSQRKFRLCWFYSSWTQMGEKNWKGSEVESQWKESALPSTQAPLVFFSCLPHISLSLQTGWLSMSARGGLTQVVHPGRALPSYSCVMSLGVVPPPPSPLLSWMRCWSLPYSKSSQRYKLYLLIFLFILFVFTLLPSLGGETRNNSSNSSRAQGRVS